MQGKIPGRARTKARRVRLYGGSAERVKDRTEAVKSAVFGTVEAKRCSLLLVTEFGWALKGDMAPTTGFAAEDLSENSTADLSESPQLHNFICARPRVEAQVTLDRGHAAIGCFEDNIRRYLRSRGWSTVFLPQGPPTDRSVLFAQQCQNPRNVLSWHLRRPR
jgi:hypothetical protein